MMNRKHVPKRRFSSFKGKWEENIFGELVVRSSETILDKNLPNVEYEDIISGEGKLNKNIFAKKNNKKGIYFTEQSVLFGKLRPYLQNWLLPNFNGIAVGDWWVLQSNKLDSKFLYMYIQTKRFQILANQSTGTKMPRSDWETVKGGTIFAPSYSEQEAIGNFFQTIDSLITLHQHKLDKLKNLKKAYLAVLFPDEGERVPKRRFPGFEGEWEEKKLEELGKVITGNTPSTSNASYWSTSSKGHTWVTPTDINDILICYSERYLSDLGWLIARTVPENSVLITSIASIGKNTINTIPVAFNQQINAIVPQNHNSYFILCAMSRYEKQFKNLAGQTATPIINKLTFEKFEIPVPSIEEQEIIGEFFKKIDKSINLQQEKLDKLKDLKKAYLNELFV